MANAVRWTGRVVAGVAVTTMLAGSLAAQTYPPLAPPDGADHDYRYQAPYDSAPPPPPRQNSYNGYQGSNYQGGDYRTGNGYDVPPPAGYDGSAPPPPPPGYNGGSLSAAQIDADRRYGDYVSDWSRRYCVKARGNAGVGAVVGGVFGALVGSSVAGWRDRGTGALVGGLVGAGAGAAVGSTTAGATSPGCPPGFVVRRDAPVFAYDGYYGADPYVYAAPGWYQPWVFYGGAWAYRPYPYHAFYYGRFGYGGYGYGRGFYGRGYGYGRGGYYGRGYRR